MSMKALLKRDLSKLFFRDTSFKVIFPEFLDLIAKAEKTRSCCSKITDTIYAESISRIETNLEKFLEYFGIESLIVLKNKTVTYLGKQKET